MSSDDLLSFKEFPPVHDTHTRGGSAQININSPQRENLYGPRMSNINKNLGSSIGYNMTADPFPLGEGELLDDMSASVQNLSNDGENMQRMDTSPQNTEKAVSVSFLSIEFYQQFFNVDTATVLDRMATAIIPKRAPVSYIKQSIDSNPDLYGPFWIVVTLIFAMAISGNLASYFQNQSADYHWQYNFHLVSYAATTIICYVCFVPLALWGAFKWFVRPTDPDLETEAPYTPNLLSLICIYGYSLCIYIPISILWVIQLNLLQWLLVLGGTFLSGSVLILVLTPALRASKYSIFIAVGVVIAHFLLAAGFMVYFFETPSGEVVATVNKPQIMVPNMGPTTSQ